jgi:parallel beta-helix repeat protein
MKILSFSFWFCLSTTFVCSQDYYVDDQGSDTNPGTESQPYKTINKAIASVDAGGTVYVMDGIYTDESAGEPFVSFYEDATQQDSAGNNYVFSNGENLNNPHVVTINKAGNETDGYITVKNYPNHRPKIIFDGQGGIKLGPNANYVIVEGFEVEGPSQSITYNQAIMNRRNRVTLKESINQNNNNYSYFSGKGIWGGYDDHHHIIIRNNIVHDTPGSGIRFNDSDYITIENNTIYNTTWWTSSASSAVVFAETIAVSDDDNTTDIKMIIRGNTVYNNWNRIPFYMSSFPDNAQPPNGNYGNAGYSTILDGQGLYVTRSDPNYNGTFLFENNLCVNNGKNGINFDRSNASSALIRNNTIYFNGAHDLVQDISVSVEGNPRHDGQKVAGIKANFVNNVTVVNNIVETRFGNYSALELFNVEGSRFVNNNIFVNGSISWGENNPSNMIDVSPEFVNPTELSDDASIMSDWETYMDNVDFSLLATSPAINAGMSEYSPQSDILGNARPVLAENIQSSSSFETSFDGWAKWSNDSSYNDIELSEQESKHGNKSIKVFGRTKNWHSAKFDLSSLVVDENYTIYLWVKNTQPNGTAQLTVRETINGAPSYNNITSPIEISSNEWTLLSADYTHQNYSDFLYVKGPPVVNGTGVDFFIDNFSLVSQGSPEVDFTSVDDIVDIGAYEYIEPSLSIDEWGNDIKSHHDITLFPNPVSNELHLINLDLQSKIKIVDISGRKYDVKTIPNLEQQSLKITLSHLQSGTYIVQVLSEKGMTKSFEIIKQ